jgi:hypothetical protein
MKSTTTETKIAANESVYQNNFYVSEAAGELAKARFDAIASTLNLVQNVPVDISGSINGTGPVANAQVTLTLIRTGNPPDSSGMGVGSSYANFYEIKTTVNGKTIRKGVWEAFPKE